MHSRENRPAKASNVAVVGLRPDGRISRWTDAASALLGYPRVPDRPFFELFEPGAVPEVRSQLDDALNGHPLTEQRLDAVRADGQRIPVIMHMMATRGIGGRTAGAVAFIRPTIDEHDQALIIEMANRIAVKILSEDTGEGALRQIAEAARTLAHAELAALGVAKAGSRELEAFITAGATPETEAAIGRWPLGHGLLGHIFDLTDPIRVEDVVGHGLYTGLPAGHPGIRNFLGVPIRRGDQVLGSLYLANKRSGPFTVSDESAVLALGAHAAVAIVHIRLLENARGVVGRLIEAHEEERRAVACDLHDGLTQLVMAAHAHLDTYRRIRGQERAERELELGLKALSEAVTESRRLIGGLRALALEDLGLLGALEQLLDEEKTRAGWQRAELNEQLGRKRFDRTLETGVYRIAQEALANARKHADATEVRVTLQEAEGRLKLEVADDGCGFDAETTERDARHFGLHSMQERARLMNGALRIETAPGAGTRVRAELPIAPERAAE